MRIRIILLLSLLLCQNLYAAVFTITPEKTSIVMSVNDTETLRYTVTNVSSTGSAILGPFSMTYYPDGSPSSNIRITDSSSTSACSSTTSLASGSSCYFDLSITGLTATSSDVLLRPKVCGYHGSGPCEVATQSNTVAITVHPTPTPTTGRIFTIKNECPYRVAFGFVSGSVQAPLIPQSGGTSCSKTDACASPLVCAYANSTATTGICSPMKDIYCNPTYYNAHAAECSTTSGTQVCGACPSGSSCNVSAGSVVDGVHTGLCFSSAPEITSPSSGSHILAAGSPSSPTTAQAHLIAPLTTVDEKWSGGIFARIVKQSGSDTSIAGWCRSDKDASKACDLGTGPQPPYTGAEFTLLRGSQDTYDVTLIDGPTIPMQMQPTSISQDSANAYLCGAAGDVSAQSGTSIALPASSWSFTAPSSSPGYNFVYLTTASESCSTNSDCTSSSVGSTCGMGYDSSDNIEGPKCGILLGHWAGAKACSFDNTTFNNLFNCKTPYAGATYFDLYKCTGVAATSCYSSGASTDCCGCENWSNTTPSKTCVSQNPTWLNDIVTHISWLKDGSPTAYSYPYDDASSTFTCPATGTSSDVGKVDYTVTFCPGGETAGVTPPSS